jgi:hypothetical protein
MAIGKPKLMTISVSVNLVALAIFLPLIDYYFGIHAALWVLALSPFFVTPLMVKFKKENQIFVFYKEFYGLIFLPIGYAVGWVAVYLFNQLEIPLPLFR